MDSNEWSDDDEVYEVENIVDDKVDEDGDVLYYIKWKNYDSTYHNTWEPTCNLNCRELLETYLKDKKKRKRKLNISTSKTLESKQINTDSKQSKQTSNGFFGNAPLSVNDTKRSFLYITDSDEELPHRKPRKRGGRTNDLNNDSDSDSDSLVGTKKNDSINKKNDSINKKNDSINKKNDSINKKNDSINKTNDRINKTNDSINKKNDIISRSNSNDSNGSNGSNIKRKIRPFQLTNNTENKPPASTSFGTIKRTKAAPRHDGLDLDTLVQGIKGSQASAKPTSKQSSTPSYVSNSKNPSMKLPPPQPISSRTPSGSSSTGTKDPRHQGSSFRPSSSSAIPPRDPRHQTDLSRPPSSSATVSNGSQRHTGSLRPPSSSVMADSRHTGIVSRPTSSSAAVATNDLRRYTGTSNPVMPPYSTSSSKKRPSHSHRTSQSKQNQFINTSRTPPEKPTPKWNGIIKIKNGGTFSVLIGLDYHPSNNKNILSFLDSGEMIVNKVVPIRAVKYLYRKSKHFITDITNIDSDYLNWSKFARFLYVNRQAAVVQSYTQPNDVLILTNTFRSNWTLEKPELTTAIHFRDLDHHYIKRNISSPPSPPLLDSGLNSSWKAMVNLLMFPEELAAMVKRKGVELQVIGSSGMSRALRAAHRSARSASTSILSSLDSSSATSETMSPLASSLIGTKVIILFDRSDDRLYRTPLKQERRATDTMIFQFGSSGPTQPITPPTVVYPKNTGGFITTDVKNILMNPDILDRMVNFAKKKNEVILGSWKPILYTEWLSHILRAGTGVPAQNAIAKIVAYLLSNDIGILENWGETPEETTRKTACLDWFDNIVRTHVDQCEAFLFVDDGPNSSSWHNNYPAIDFIKSSALPP